MSISRGYRLPVKVIQPQRPFGVAVLAALGVIASLLIIVAALFGIWFLSRISVEPSLQFAALALQLIAGLLMLRINWGFWELLRWAWWANLALTLLGIAGAVYAMRFAPTLGQALGQLRPEFTAQAIATVARGVLIGDLGLNMLVLVYLFTVRTAFGIGVKDERPLWEKAHRH
jgi:hypothetical protein